MSLIAHPSLASPHHQSSRADIAARSMMSDRFRSSLLASVSSTNHRQRLPKSSSSYSSALKSPNDHQARDQSGEGERQRRRRRDVILLPTFTALVLATSSTTGTFLGAENAAHAMLVDESKIDQCCFNDFRIFSERFQRRNRTSRLVRFRVVNRRKRQ